MTEPLTGQRRFLAERNARCLARAKAAFVELTHWHHYGKRTLAGAFIRHYCRIRSLPSREWHGRTLYLPTCLCCGKRRGVPEYLLWHLVDPCHFICEWCARAGRVPATAAKEMPDG